MIGEADYSVYTLPQLFKARYWVDMQGRPLEEEIQKRCAHIHDRINGKRSPAARSSSRFRPYGLIFGGAFFLFSVAPFIVIKFLGAINIINDVSGDLESLSGLWAILTLPAMVVVFVIGAMMDAERVVKWFNLAGR